MGFLQGNILMLGYMEFNMNKVSNKITLSVLIKTGPRLIQQLIKEAILLKWLNASQKPALTSNFFLFLSIGI